jgi:hypothetical protein
MLELGVDLGATGLDKYGTIGPRLGLMGGENTLVGTIRARAFECGLEARQMLYAGVVRMLEQYRPELVRDLIASTKRVAAALKPIFGSRVYATPTTAQLHADDLLEIAMARAGVTKPPIVRYEAAAAFCMLLLEDPSDGSPCTSSGCRPGRPTSCSSSSRPDPRAVRGGRSASCGPSTPCSTGWLRSSRTLDASPISSSGRHSGDSHA